MAKNHLKIFIITALILSGFAIGLSAWTQTSTFTWVGNVFNGFWPSNAPLLNVPPGPENMPPSISILSPQNNEIFYATTTTSIDFHLNANTADFSNKITSIILYNKASEGNVEIARATNGLGSYSYDGIVNWSITCASPPCIGDYTIYAEATDNNGLKGDSADVTLHVATQPALAVSTYDYATATKDPRTEFPPHPRIGIKVTVSNPALFQDMQVWVTEVPTPPATTHWGQVGGAHWVGHHITDTLYADLQGGLEHENNYLLKVIGTTLAPSSQVIESPEFTFTIASEICDNGVDEDGDDVLDNGCLKISFNIANTPNNYDNYHVYIKLHSEPDETKYKPLQAIDDITNFPPPMTRDDRFFLYAVHGSKTFAYFVLPGEYDIKVVYNTSHLNPLPGTNPQSFYRDTLLNISMAGTGAIVNINSVTTAGAFLGVIGGGGGNPNTCTQGADANTYACTFKSVECLGYTPAGLYGAGCSGDSANTINPATPSTTGPGRAVFDVKVLASNSRIVYITSPANNQTYVTGNIINVTTSILSPNPVTKVEFYGGASGETLLPNQPPDWLNPDITSPFSYFFGWPTYVPPGTYILKAKAYDSQGTFTSAPVTIIVH